MDCILRHRLPARLPLLTFFVLLAAAVSHAQQTEKSAVASALVPERSAPTLANKAPGAPGYGLQVAASTGKFMMTNLAYHPVTRKPSAQIFLITSPAGSGPYRLGIDVSFYPKQPLPARHPDPVFFENHFLIAKVEDGSPAKKAGLVPLMAIDSVDGSNFGWNLNALSYHISNSPVVELRTLKSSTFGHPVWKTYRIQTRKLETPVDPADGALVSVEPPKEVIAWGQARQTWKDLLILRSSVPQFAPLAFETGGRKLWVANSQGDPIVGNVPSRYLEFWKGDPATGPYDTEVVDVWPEPADGMQSGRVLSIEDRWYRVKSYAKDAATRRLVSFELTPWEADVPRLLRGETLADELGPTRAAWAREVLEQAGNDALLEWKTRTLPRFLLTERSATLEDLVVNMEKGLLALDLQVRSIRQWLDAQARAQIAQQAQADKPGGGQTTEKTSAAPTGESERLADLLEQRKAILQAILGSVKQTLAQTRR